MLTKSKQTREQWLDKHCIDDEALRSQTLSNFDARDDIQFYVSKMQMPGFLGDRFEIDDLLSLPGWLGARRCT